ncbi:siderophore biosynthesis protein SbnC, partial [Staphylococcus aureus]|nr:siderophore biosynthesis protein SbnC [Staphylococcus aureus]
GIVSYSEITIEFGHTILIFYRVTHLFFIPVYFSALYMFRYECSQQITIEGRLSKLPLTSAEFWLTIANMNCDLCHEWEV